MRNLYFENQGSNTFLVYQIVPEDNIDTLSLGMITHNSIPSIVPTFFTQMNEIKYIKFDVSSKVSVRQFFSGIVNKRSFLGVLSGIADAMSSAEEYMINADTIILDLDYIFTDVSSCATSLICLPIETAEHTDLAQFIKGIVFSTQFNQSENCDYVAKIISCLNSSSYFSVNELKKVIDEIKIEDNKKNPGISNTTTNNQTQKSVSYQSPATRRPGERIETNQKEFINIQQVPLSQRSNTQPEVVNYQNRQSNSKETLPRSVPNENIKAQGRASVENIQSSQRPSPPKSNEKGMSMFYLLQHYNKENAEIYKAQKAAKKAAKGQTVAAPNTKKSGQKQVTTGFSVPGAPSNNSFAVPGAPVNNKFGVPDTPSNTGFCVPGATVNNGYNAPKQQKQKQAAVTSQTPIAQKPVQQQAQYVQAPQTAVPQGQAANFGETTVLNGGGKIGETTVLGVSSPEVQIQPHLIRTKNNERINLNKPVFRIGKEKSYVDYFVSDNTAVSRSHANIISRDGQYFIVDTNSTNHTYVNGGMIQSNVETPLSHGAKIRLANEDFEFKLY